MIVTMLTHRILAMTGKGDDGWYRGAGLLRHDAYASPMKSTLRGRVDAACGWTALAGLLNIATNRMPANANGTGLAEFIDGAPLFFD